MLGTVFEEPVCARAVKRADVQVFESRQDGRQRQPVIICGDKKVGEYIQSAIPVTSLIQFEGGIDGCINQGGRSTCYIRCKLVVGELLKLAVWLRR